MLGECEGCIINHPGAYFYGNLKTYIMKNAEFLVLIASNPSIGFEKSSLVAFDQIADATDKVLEDRLPDLTGMTLPEGKVITIHALKQAVAHDPEDPTKKLLRNKRPATLGAFFLVSIEGEAKIMRVPANQLAGALLDPKDPNVLKAGNDEKIMAKYELALTNPAMEKRTAPYAQYARSLVNNSFRVLNVFKGVQKFVPANPEKGWAAGNIASNIVLLGERKPAE